MSTARRRPIKYYSAKRRAVYARGDVIDSVVLFDLFDWRCFICEKTIDRKRRFPDFQAATIEHIIPLSAGGTHTWDNVAPAHALCNFNKGDSIGNVLKSHSTGLDRPVYALLH